MPTEAVQLAATHRLRVRRVPVLALAGLLVSAWIVFSFGRMLTTLNDAELRAVSLRTETAALEMRLRQGQAEMDIAQTASFQRMLARSYGIGPSGERAFALEPGAPPAPAVIPLGGDPDAVDGTPLEAWIRLLLGD